MLLSPGVDRADSLQSLRGTLLGPVGMPLHTGSRGIGLAQLATLSRLPRHRHPGSLEGSGSRHGPVT